MFDGKRFLPETGTPIRKIACMIRLLALAEPEPFTFASLIAKSFMPLSMLPPGQLALHNRSVTRISACPTQPWGIARRRGRSERKGLRPSSSNVRFGAAFGRRRAPDPDSPRGRRGDDEWPPPDHPLQS